MASQHLSLFILQPELCTDQNLKTYHLDETPPSYSKSQALEEWEDMHPNQ